MLPFLPVPPANAQPSRLHPGGAVALAALLIACCIASVRAADNYPPVRLAPPTLPSAPTAPRSIDSAAADTAPRLTAPQQSVAAPQPANNAPQPGHAPPPRNAPPPRQRSNVVAAEPAPHAPRGHLVLPLAPPAETAAPPDGHCATCNVHPEPAFGASYYATFQAQVGKGEAALMVLYHYDFHPGQATLNYRGRLQLQKIARLVPQNPFPVIVQATRHDPALDARRQAHVITELAQMPFPIPPQRVVIGLPPVRGLDGIEAELIHGNLLNLTLVGDAAGQTATPGSGMGSPVPTAR